ncbi:hypothetical protein G5714_002688 [Onychostoma macrolepis]|uniref:Uncharacterized protein n=1 Tax=Onychostoma macrolepis TaxID=369639 RepID=A0A7J6D7D8_9TELE|nr:hypothetical protein G5714_002688 [Onychostoma macrolepis]
MCFWVMLHFHCTSTWFDPIQCASVSQTFYRHPAQPAHQDHLKTRQSTVMDILQPKAANDLQWQRKEQRDCDTSGHLTPSLNHQEPTSIISRASDRRLKKSPILPMHQKKLKRKIRIIHFPQTLPGEGQTSDSLPDATWHQTPPREEHPLKPVEHPRSSQTTLDGATGPHAQQRNLYQHNSGKLKSVPP